jgi:PAS domain S-box-containing protein
MVAWLALPVSAITLLAGWALGTSDFVGWAVAGLVMFLVATAQLLVHRPNGPFLMATAATVLAVTVRFSAPDPTAAAAAGIVAVGFLVTAVDPSSRAPLYFLWTSAMVGTTLWQEYPGWPVTIALGVLFLTLAIIWTVVRDGAHSLERAERRYRTLFEHGGDGLIAVDHSGRIALTNGQACRTFGYEPGQLRGMSISQLLPDGPDPLEHATTGGRRTPTRGRSADGAVFPADVAAASIEVGGEELVMITVRNVSSRVRAETLAVERERVYRELFDGVPIGLYRTTPQGTILDANPALARILGFEGHGQMVGLEAGGFYADAGERSRLQEILHAADGPVAVEMRLRRTDGRVIWVRDRVRVRRSADGSIGSYEGAMLDITEEKRAFQELEFEIRSKTELVAAVSHELRTPLTAVVGFIELLQSDPEIGDSERAELIALAGEQATDLALLIEDLLTSAHIEQDELIVRPETTNLADCVTQAIEAVGSRGRGEVRNRVPENLVCWCDPARLRQIVRNLVGNGLTHGAPPVTVGAARIGHGMVEIVVTDSGEGVPDHLTDRIFESFFRGHGGTNPGSIGLGLAVSKRLANLMDGDLCYRNSSRGPSFVLTLPGRRPVQGAAPPAGGTSPGSSAADRTAAAR